MVGSRRTLAKTVVENPIGNVDDEAPGGGAVWLRRDGERRTGTLLDSVQRIRRAGCCVAAGRWRGAALGTDLRR